MVGKYNRAAGSLFIALLAMIGSYVAHAEVVRGQSRELGIRFEVEGGANWCHSEVSVALSAAARQAFQPEALQFIQMLGRIRAVILDQCPPVERILFLGRADGQTVTGLEMTQLTHWARIIKIDPATREPECPSELATQDCAKHVQAYSLINRLMRGPQFAEVEVTTLLDPSESAHAIWKDKDVVGKLTIKDHGDFNRHFGSSQELGDAAILEISNACSRTGGQPERSWSENWKSLSSDPIAVRGMSCVNSSVHHHALIVSSTPSQFRVFAFLSEREDADATHSAARIMAQTMLSLQ